MDWPTVTVTRHIAVFPDRVWQLVSDIGLMPTFSDELQSVEWLDGGSPREGAQFIGTNAHPAIGTWTTRSVIVECAAPRVFAWAVGDPENPSATWRFNLRDSPGGTDLWYTACIGPGPSGVTMLAERDPQKRDHIVGRPAASIRAGHDSCAGRHQGGRRVW